MSSSGFYQVLPCLNDSNRVIPVFFLELPGFMKVERVLTSVTSCYEILQAFTRFYWVVLDQMEYFLFGLRYLVSAFFHY